MEQMLLRGRGALELFCDSYNVVFVVAFEYISDVMVNNVGDARAVLGAETVRWWFYGIPRYHYLGGRGEENTFLAPNGAEMLTRVDGECS